MASAIYCLTLTSRNANATHGVDDNRDTQEDPDESFPTYTERRILASLIGTRRRS